MGSVMDQPRPWEEDYHKQDDGMINKTTRGAVEAITDYPHPPPPMGTALCRDYLVDHLGELDRQLGEAQSQKKFWDARVTTLSRQIEAIKVSLKPLENELGTDQAGPARAT